MASDKTSYLQCLTHMIKGNLGAGILAMPASFAHTGLVGAFVGLPLLCFISAYCVHLLVGSAQKVEQKSGGQKFSQDQVNYAKLARGAFELGPKWAHKFSESVGRSVDICLLVTQIGVCCIYIIFVVDNVNSILANNHVFIPKTMIFLAILPVTIMLSFIRTLSRLTLASLVANLLQTIGLALVVEYLIRDLEEVVDLKERDNFRPISEMALGFGSVMFAFEGISVVLPLYSHMRRPKLMASCLGVVNVSFFIILVLYFIMGLLGYLKFGHQVRDSITLSLPGTPLYDAVRAMFTASILLSYPLQFYVPNEIIWTWAEKNLMKPTKRAPSHFRGSLVVLPIAASKVHPDAGSARGAAGLVGEHSQCQAAEPSAQQQQQQQQQRATTSTKLAINLAEFSESPTTGDKKVVVLAVGGKQSLALDDNRLPQRYEYYCRLIIVLLTFTLAMSVPKLNLLMDLIGSFSGTALCLTIPALIHLVACWDDTKGFVKVVVMLVDIFVIFASLCAGLGGSLSSLVSIVRSFSHGMLD